MNDAYEIKNYDMTVEEAFEAWEKEKWERNKGGQTFVRSLRSWKPMVHKVVKGK